MRIEVTREGKDRGSIIVKPTRVGETKEVIISGGTRKERKEALRAWKERIQPLGPAGHGS